MKNFCYTTLIIALILSACRPENHSYQYNYNPQFTHGYAIYYGSYYADYGNANAVLSLSLFTDSLKVNEYGELEGTGHYLYISDIFMHPQDIYMPDGAYTASDSGEAFSFYRGEIFKVDGTENELYARVYFIEKDSRLSKKQLIDRGQFTVSNDNSVQTINFDLVLDDSTRLQGRFIGTIPYYDQQ
jgi:hypothetical protein